MRSIGYAKHSNAAGEESYVRRASGLEFPRFHVYVNEFDTPVTLSIHLDQKEHTYEGSRAHSGEYDGAVVQRELERIHAALGIPMALMVDKSGKPILR